MARSKFEILAQKELEKQNYKVDWKARPRYAGGIPVDFFNLFDLIAIRPGDPVRWISIKPASNCPVEHQEAIRHFWLPENNQKEIWKYDREPKDKRRIRVRKFIF